MEVSAIEALRGNFRIRLDILNFSHHCVSYPGNTSHAVWNGDMACRVTVCLLTASESQGTKLSETVTRCRVSSAFKALSAQNMVRLAHQIEVWTTQAAPEDICSEAFYGYVPLPVPQRATPARLDRVFHMLSLNNIVSRG